jgi:hypothetical protein
MELFIGFILGYVAAIIIVANAGVTDDSKIERGAKIKNAVYQCEKKQELDLK